jgi:hypothetical protein
LRCACAPVKGLDGRAHLVHAGEVLVVGDEDHHRLAGVRAVVLRRRGGRRGQRGEREQRAEEGREGSPEARHREAA